MRPVFADSLKKWAPQSEWICKGARGSSRAFYEKRRSVNSALLCLFANVILQSSRGGFGLWFLPPLRNLWARKSLVVRRFPAISAYIDSVGDRRLSYLVIKAWKLRLFRCEFLPSLLSSQSRACTLFCTHRFCGRAFLERLKRCFRDAAGVHFFVSTLAPFLQGWACHSQLERSFPLPEVQLGCVFGVPFGLKATRLSSGEITRPAGETASSHAIYGRCQAEA